MADLYFKQLLAGRDFGLGDPIAAQMQNFVYLIGDREAGECVVVDPAWAVDDLVDIVEAEDMKLVGALATHYHPDHVGGHIFGIDIEGLAELMAQSAPAVPSPERASSAAKPTTKPIGTPSCSFASFSL